MLYNNSEILKDVAWIVFDEVHFLNDYSRGFVWENSLILLRKHQQIRYVFYQPQFQMRKNLLNGFAISTDNHVIVFVQHIGQRLYNITYFLHTEMKFIQLSKMEFLINIISMKP